MIDASLPGTVTWIIASAFASRMTAWIVCVLADVPSGIVIGVWNFPWAFTVTLPSGVPPSSVRTTSSLVASVFAVTTLSITLHGLHVIRSQSRARNWYAVLGVRLAAS